MFVLKLTGIQKYYIVKSTGFINNIRAFNDLNQTHVILPFLINDTIGQFS